MQGLVSLIPYRAQDVPNLPDSHTTAATKLLSVNSDH